MTEASFAEKFSALPVCQLKDKIPSTALILSPHPDDETLGCGGLIAESVRQHTPPVIVMVSDGSGSHPGSREWPPQKLALQRQQEARDAVECLGLPPDRIFFLNLKDRSVPTDGPVFHKAVQHILKLITEYHCTSLLIPWRHDPHCDHLATWFMGQAVKKQRPYLHLFSYPVWGLTLSSDRISDAGTPRGWRLDIAPHLQEKRRAMQAYKSQTGQLITDDPEGFVLTEELLQIFLSPYEVFLST